ncbi:MAG: ribonuclease D [Polaribacter sp.]|jgi:ribonuclease D
MDYTYINSHQKLADFCTRIETADYCAIDTEFVREKTYYPVLALIQIATEQHMGCIDPLAFDDFEPLKKLLQKPDLIKVFHSSSQDLEILFQSYNQIPTPVFDTQLAAAVLGYNHQIGYADLVQNITEVQLEKKYTRANWVHRPLTEGELDYAMDDVRYLMPVYRHLKAELEAKNRGAWIEKELQSMSAESTYQLDTTQLWKKLKGSQKLKGVQLQIASLLCQWREQLAQKKNLPKRWVIKDELIFDIARLKPGSVSELASIRDASEKFVEQYAKAVFDIITNAQEIDASEWPKHDKAKVLTSGQQSIGDCLMALCREIAEENNIALATLATRKDIDNLIINRKNSQLSQGWRFEMAGEKLLDFIHGQTGIAVEDNGIKLIVAH